MCICKQEAEAGRGRADQFMLADVRCGEGIQGQIFKPWRIALCWDFEPLWHLKCENVVSRLWRDLGAQPRSSLIHT